MISRIEIKGIPPYDNGVTLDNLHKINYIYGANASGKTTLSNFLQQNEDEKYVNCKLKWENDIKEEIYVYNKVFREKNFGSGSIPGVFTLGQATKEDIEKIEKKNKELNDLKDQGVQKKKVLEKQKQTKDECVNSFREEAWSLIYKKHETVFSVAFEGYKSKERFENKLCSESENNKLVIKSYEDLLQRAKTLFAKTPTLIDKLPEISFDNIVEIENNSLWKKKIIGKSDVDIAKLINRLNIGDWVNEGRKFLENGSSICPFCQKETIDDNFRSQIESFFDETFITETFRLKNLQNDYSSFCQNIINQLEEIEAKGKRDDNANLDIELFSAYLKTLISQINSNKELIGNKIKEPSRVVDLVSNKEQFTLLFGLLKNANDKISEHNKLVANYKTEKSNLIKEIWKYLVDENDEKISAYKKKINGLQKGIDNIDGQLKDLRREYSNLDAEIKDLNKNVTSVQPTVDEINKLLVSYGFSNFTISPTKDNPNQYYIKRDNGDNANLTLSEGETTFITFLYFLQLIHGGINPEKVNEKRIVVIDDPISSLDSNVLFVVSSLIKEVVKDIRKGVGNINQIIVLTHNVYFHKELSNLYLLTKENQGKDLNPYYWILRKNNDVSSVKYFEQDNPIKNSYELLWSELRDKSDSSCITIQNIMRRIVETYFRTLGGYKDDDILEKFDNPQEKEICRSLIYWMNDGSHCVQDDLFIEQDDDVMEKYFRVFEQMFTKMGHGSHYKMMMKVLNSN